MNELDPGLGVVISVREVSEQNCNAPCEAFAEVVLVEPVPDMNEASVEPRNVGS